MAVRRTLYEVLGAADIGFLDVVGGWPFRLVLFGLVLIVLWRLGFRRRRT